MPISNYTTTINANKTIGEIQEILANQGAEKIMIDYKNKVPVAISFMYQLKGKEIAFVLPANYLGVLDAMRKDKEVPRSKCNDQQALKVSWRILLNWIEAQMAMVQAEQAEILEVFFPYVQLPSGETMYKKAVKDNVLKLSE